MPSPQRRGQGQWALGHLEPLNAAERFKKDDAGLNVRDRIVNRYAHLGFDSIDPADLRGRFRWWGLYTQRRPGIEGGRTGALEDAEIEDSYFMMRVRIPGGQLSSDQLRTVADIAKEYGRDLADITDRQNVQYHWIRIEDVPDIWARLEEVGLSSIQACGDVPRNILGCPVAGLDAGEILDATAVLRATEAVAANNPEFGNLPRKFKTAISGCASHCTAHEVNDISFVGVLGPDGTPGFDLWVGGGLSTNPMIAQRLGVFVRPDQVPAVWAGRRGPVPRLRLPAAAQPGPDQVPGRRLGRGAVPGGAGDGVPRRGAARRPGPRGPRGRPRPHRRAPPERRPLLRGRGPARGTQLRHPALAGGRAGRRLRLRPDPHHHRAEAADPRRPRGALPTTCWPIWRARTCRPSPSAFRRGTMACTGIEFCKLAIVETKGRARELYTELERRLPDFDTPITINVNGCPNSCARFQLADIGLKGSIVDGTEGFQVHLGGSLGTDPSFGRKLRGLKVTADGLTDYVERLLRSYQADRTDGEEFATWVRRADEKLLTRQARR